MAHVRYMSRQGESGGVRSADRWLKAMEEFVQVEKEDRKMIGLDKAGMSLGHEQ